MFENLFLAQVSDGGFLSSGIAWTVILAAVLVITFAMLVARYYKRCPSNRVLVIYGKVGAGDSAKCIHGGAAFVIPFLQDYDYMSLEPILIEIPLKGALSIENIRVNVPSVFTVAIGKEMVYMQNAAIRFLGKTNDEIKHTAQDIIFGQLRQVIASMRIEDINRDRDKFLHNIQNSLEPELRKVGLELINVNVTDITDEAGYIEAIGQKAASQAVQQARGDVAEQEKLGEVRVAEAERDKAVQVANAGKQRNIAIREAQQEQAVRIAELEKAQKVAEQSAAYERDAQIKNSEQQMRIQVANANSKAIAGEAKSQAEIAGAQAELQVKQAEAYRLAETKKREAEAAVQEAQNRAMAKAALAQAERVEAERRAALEAPAKAEKAKVIVDAQADAEKRKIEAQAQAAANFAQLEAEARGQYEMLAKKGEGLKAIIEACGGAEQAFKLLMLEHLDTLAHTAATAISNIKFDKIVVWDSNLASGQSATANFLHGMSRSMPPMMQVLKDVAGVELPEYLTKLTPEASPQGKEKSVEAEPVKPNTKNA